MFKPFPSNEKNDSSDEEEVCLIDLLSKSKFPEHLLVPTETEKPQKTDPKEKPQKTEPKKTRAKKPEGYPKQALSAYMFFSKDIRAEVSAEHPEIKAQGEISKFIGEKWSTLSAEEKEKYNEMHEIDKKRFEEEKAAWTPEASMDEKVLEKKPKKPIQDDKPIQDSDSDHETSVEYIDYDSDIADSAITTLEDIIRRIDEKQLGKFLRDLGNRLNVELSHSGKTTLVSCMLDKR